MADKQISVFAKLKDGMSKPLASIQTKSNAFKKEMEGVNRALRPMNQAFAETKKALGSAAMIFGTVAAAGYGAYRVFDSLVLQTAKANDELAKLSERTGMSTEMLSILKYQGSLADVTMGDLQTSFLKFSKSIGEAQIGTKAQVDAFNMLGISLRDQSGQMKSMDQLYLETAEAFKRLTNEEMKGKLAMDLYGRSGQIMLTMLNEGAGGFRTASDEADRYNRIVGQDAAAASERLNDDLERMNQQWSGMKQSIGEIAIPYLADLATAMNGLGEEAEKGNILIDTLRVLMETSSSIAEGLHLQPVVDLYDYLQVKLTDVADGADAAKTEIDRLAQADATGTVVEINKVADALAGATDEAYELEKALARFGSEEDIMSVGREYGFDKPEKPKKGRSGASKPKAEDDIKAYNKSILDLQMDAMDEEEKLLTEQANAVAEINARPYSQDEKDRVIDLVNEYYDGVKEARENADAVALAQEELEMLKQADEEYWDWKVEQNITHWQTILDDTEAMGDLINGSIETMSQGMTDIWADSLSDMIRGTEQSKSAFGKAVGSLVGGIAQQFGQFYVLQGIAKIAEAGWPPNPVAADSGFRELAAGIALKTFGSLLGKSTAGGGGGDGKSGGGGGPKKKPDKLPGEGTASAERGKGQAIVYVAEGVVVDTKKFAKGLLEQLQDATQMDYKFQVVSNHGESLAGQ